MDVAEDAADISDDCTNSHSTIRSRRMQLGTLGYLSLISSMTQPARSLAARAVPELPVDRSAMPTPPSPTHSSVPGSSSTTDAAEGGYNSDPPPPLEDGSDSDASVSATSADRPARGRRPARRPRRMLGRPRVESIQERQRVLSGHILAALRRLLGMRTLLGASVGSGMMAQVVGSPSSPSRFLFCVTGPQAVDLATLWLAPNGATLCSCWGHTENVALLSMAGQDSSCWHAQAFKAAVENLPDHRAELSTPLLVTPDVKPYAANISTFRGQAAAAFDGVIYSPVVATRRQHIKCIAVGCRSTQRRCHHAALVRSLDRLAQQSKGIGDSTDDSSGDEEAGVQQEEEEDETIDEEELIPISKERQKRNLVPCTEEDQQGLKWARTAEWAAVDVPGNAIFSAPRLDEDGQPCPPSKPPTLVGRMAELGLANDPSDVLKEKRCFTCGEEMHDGARHVEIPASLYADGNSSAPLEVFFYFCIAVFPCRPRFCFFLAYLPFVLCTGTVAWWLLSLPSGSLRVLFRGMWLDDD